MKGLMKKDYILIKKNSLVYLLLFGVFLIISVGKALSSHEPDTMIFSGYMAMAPFILAINTFAYDDLAKWDSYCLSMPVTRAEAVLARYASLGTVAVAVCLMGTIVSLIVGIMVGQLQMGYILLTSLILLGIALLALAVLLPLIYKFGVEKSRILLIILMLAFMSVVVIGGKEMPVPAINFMIRLLPVVGIVLYAVSFYISSAIYQRKEF